MLFSCIMIYPIFFKEKGDFYFSFFFLFMCLYLINYGPKANSILYVWIVNEEVEGITLNPNLIIRLGWWVDMQWVELCKIQVRVY